jgi:hypothetical protein
MLDSDSSINVYSDFKTPVFGTEIGIWWPAATSADKKAPKGDY